MGSPTQNSSQKMKTAIIFQLTFICLITAQDQSTTQSQGDCCPWKTVGDNTYYFIRKDPIAYHHDCKSDCIYKKYYNQTATTHTNHLMKLNTVSKWGFCPPNVS